MSVGAQDTTEINIGISPQYWQEIGEGVSRLLADSYTLYLTTRNFHWTATRPMFNTLHLMFMQQYSESWTALDLIAECIPTLGFSAPRTYKEFARFASVEEISAVPKAMHVVRHLRVIDGGAGGEKPLG